jgi:hypothetical protein
MRERELETISRHIALGAPAGFGPVYQRPPVPALDLAEWREYRCGTTVFVCDIRGHPRTV